MKRLFILGFMFLSVNSTHSFTGVYVGWEQFVSPALPADTTADVLTYGFMGNTPTRVYFYYNMLGHAIFTKGATPGYLGWGLDLAGGIGYRFLNTAHKRYGWDIGMDAFGYVTPYFLNSESSFTETAIYYGIGMGFTTVYKINPYIGMGLRASMKYNIGANYISSKLPSAGGIIFTIGSLITF